MAKTYEVKTRFTVVDEATAAARRVASSFASVGASAASSTAGMLALVGGTAAVLGAFKAVIDASSEQEDALRALDSALALKGMEAYSDALREQADALQKTTKFADENINSAQALIATYGVAGDQLELATQAAVDLAARLNIDLDSAARQVAGTINGFTKGVDKVVPALKNMSDAALRGGDGIRAIADEMRGGAIEAADTFSGRLAILGNKLGEVFEKVGDGIAKNKQIAAAFETAGLAADFLAEKLDFAEQATTDYGDIVGELDKTIEAYGRTVEKVAQIQDRSTRIMVEQATGLSRASQIAEELGIVLERDVIAKREREAALYKELADLGQDGIDVRIAEKEATEDLAVAVEDLDGATRGAAAAQEQFNVTLVESQRQMLFTSQAFDQMARTLGRGEATEAAVAAGGRTILKGTRVLLPGGGSRLTSTPGLAGKTGTNGGSFG